MEAVGHLAGLGSPTSAAADGQVILIPAFKEQTCPGHRSLLQVLGR